MQNLKQSITKTNTTEQNESFDFIRIEKRLKVA